MAKPKKRRVTADRRATAKEVAKLAGVSVSAVSRTFTEGASVSPQTREKVLTATRMVGYTPNALARSLMTKRTELIGLVCDNFDNPLFMEIFDLFTRRLQQYGRRPLLANLSGGIRTDGALAMLGHGLRLLARGFDHFAETVLRVLHGPAGVVHMISGQKF